MADNKNTPVIPEEPAETPEDPGYSYEDIKDKDIHDVAGEPEEKETPTEEEKPEEKVEEPKEEPVDINKVAEEAATKALEAQEAKRQADEEARKAAETPEVIDPKTEYQQIAEDFEKKEGRTPTWDELAVKIEERTLEKLEARQAAQAQAAEDARLTEQKQQASEQQELNSHIDDELQDLYKANKLTPIKDKNNPSDPGVIERQSLFAEMAKVNRQRASEGKPLIASPIRIAEYYWTKPTTQPAGADAPVAGNQASSVTPQSEQEYSYADIKKPWHFFRRGK